MAEELIAVPGRVPRLVGKAQRDAVFSDLSEVFRHDPVQLPDAALRVRLQMAADAATWSELGRALDGVRSETYIETLLRSVPDATFPQWPSSAVELRPQVPDRVVGSAQLEAVVGALNLMFEHDEVLLPFQRYQDRLTSALSAAEWSELAEALGGLTSTAHIESLLADFPGEETYAPLQELPFTKFASVAERVKGAERIDAAFLLELDSYIRWRASQKPPKEAHPFYIDANEHAAQEAWTLGQENADKRLLLLGLAGKWATHCARIGIKKRLDSGSNGRGWFDMDALYLEGPDSRQVRLVLRTLVRQLEGTTPTEDLWPAVVTTTFRRWVLATTLFGSTAAPLSGYTAAATLDPAAAQLQFPPRRALQRWLNPQPFHPDSSWRRHFADRRPAGPPPGSSSIEHRS